MSIQLPQDDTLEIVQKGPRCLFGYVDRLRLSSTNMQYRESVVQECILEQKN